MEKDPIRLECLCLYRNLNLSSWLFYFVFVGLIFGCKKGPELKVVNINGNRIVGYYINGKPDGVFKYYDTKGNLRKIANYSMGVMEGPLIKYFPNGRVSDSVLYHSDIIDGYWQYFDTAGNLAFSNYYYKNLECGPLMWYLDNKLFKYEFISFDKRALASAYFKTNGQFDSLNYFKMGFNIHEKNSKLLNLFAYLPKIPETDQHFAIGITNKSNTKELYTVGGSNFIVDTVLGYPPDGWNYYISCHIQNKLKSYDRLYIEELAFQK